MNGQLMLSQRNRRPVPASESRSIIRRFLLFACIAGALAVVPAAWPQGVTDQNLEEQASAGSRNWDAASREENADELAERYREALGNVDAAATTEKVQVFLASFRVETASDYGLVGLIVVAALFLCFAGIQIHDMSLPMIAILVGASLGCSLGYGIGQTTGGLVGAVVGGVLGLVGLALFHRIAIFAAGSFVAVYTVFGVTLLAGPETIEPVFTGILVLAAVGVGGWLALKYYGHAILFGSAFGGAMVVVLGTGALLGIWSTLDGSGFVRAAGIVTLVLWGILGAAGARVQYRRALAAAIAAAPQDADDIEVIVLRRRPR